MDIARPVSSSVASVSFSFLTSDDIRRISVKQIVNPVLLDNLNQPTIGGLYDPALGPSSFREICVTCHLDYFQCPGHFGHIELPAPVYHPLFMMNMYKLLRCTCLFCHHFKVPRLQVIKTVAKLRLLERGLMDAAKAVDDINATDGKIKEEGEENTDKDEQVAIFKVELYVETQIGFTPQAKRGDYKDGMVYQARKATIEEFLKYALGSTKKCQRKQCGANAYTFRKEGYTKIIEYDLTPKQKERHLLAGLKLPDVFAFDQVIARSEFSKQKSEPAEEDSESGSDSAMEVNEVNKDDDDDSASEGEGDDTADVPVVARAVNGRTKGSRGRNERVMSPEEVRAHLRWLFRNESSLCSLMFGRHGPFAIINTQGFSPSSADIFFLDALAISPTRFRPPARMDDKLLEHPHNVHLTKVLNISYALRDITNELRAASSKDAADIPVDRNKLLGQLYERLIMLQSEVNSFIDSSKNPTPVRQGKLPVPGVKQGLEKKEGLFRMHMMGKRVNYAARSVISPDVNIETNEIGVPPIFAAKLTFPEPVTQHNVTELRELVIRGAHEHPGASMVQFEDGTTQALDKLNVEQRTAIANQLLTPRGVETRTTTLHTKAPAVGKKVYRHLRDGDILILNRQPTLHKPSMMAHKAKVLRGEKTIRMHYANCNSYNADFDGDEMNIHFPQTQIARSEAVHIANTDNQYLVPTSGKPLRGLIQDHVVGGVWLTNKATFFTREEYQQLIYGALRPENNYTGGGRVITVPPAIFKPQPLWTGKQVISTILRNITPSNTSSLTMESSSQVTNASWARPGKVFENLDLSKDERKRLEMALSEEKVLVVGGDLVQGILDKSQFGAASYGLVHSVYDVYGAEVAGRLLSILSRLFTKYLQHRAFTCRMDDLALTRQGESKRKSALESGTEFGTEATLSFFNDISISSSQSEEEKRRELDGMLGKVIRDDAQMAGLDNIVKGKMKKLSEVVVGAILPDGLLRPFPENHMQLMTTSGAKGSSTNARQISALLGQQELEGRRVPVMVSGKTLPSFRPFETAAIAGGYIGSRFLTGLRPQEFYFHCMAGREGLIDTAVKTSRSGYLQRCLIKHLEGIRVHYDHTVRGSDSAVYQFLYGEDSLDVTKQMHLHEFTFNLKNNQSLATKFAARRLAGIVDEDTAVDHMKKVLKKKKKRHGEKISLTPTINEFSPSRYLGATSERFAERVDEYVKTNKDHLLVVKGQTNQLETIKPILSSKLFRALMWVRYMRSLVEPGEAVGLLASQGVGEPSTQMTLNTFHFAGHGAANVTLGIPRLREIIMTAATNPKTPMITLPIRHGVKYEDVQRFCQQASRLTLSQLVENVSVAEQVQLQGTPRKKTFAVHLKLYPPNECMELHHIQPSQLSIALVRLALNLKKDITMEFKKLEADLKGQVAAIGKGTAARDQPDMEEDEIIETNARDDVSEIGDGDADAQKRAQQGAEQTTYDEGSDQENEPEEQDDNENALDDRGFESGTDSEESIVDDDEAVTESNATITGKQWSSFKKEIQVAFANALPVIPKTFLFDEHNGLQFQLEYDLQIPKLLLVEVIERACLKCVVNSVPGVTKCHPPLQRHKSIVNGVVSGDLDIVVEGSNVRGIAHLAEEIVQINNIKTNNIYAVLKTYGVEAARATIVQEIASVFDLYSINVNIRHLMLIADYMTFDGGFKPFNRSGISTHSSPLLKASYETTAAFLSDATLHGDFDNLTTPSGNIVVGRPALNGTGVFDVVLDVLA